MSYIGSTPANKLVTSSDMEDGIVTTAKIANDAATADKIANAINSAITANTSKTTNATHSGEVTGSGALTIAGNVVDEANLKVSNSPTNGYMLTAQSGNTGGLTWVAAPSGSLSMAQQWRLTANLNCNTVNQDTDITANLEAIDTQSPGSIGSGMSVSSGVFTFPSTGIYYIVNNFGMFISSGGSPYSGVLITVSTNASSGSPTFAYATEPYLHTVGQYSHGGSDYIVNVTNTSNVKVKLKYHVNGATVLRGHSNHNQTSLTFIKLA